MDEQTVKDKIRGSLVGGAVGDALGYPVEFISSYIGLQNRYGERGITRYELNENGKALISDDTQMTLFTACGLLNAVKDDSPLIPSSVKLTWNGTTPRWESARRAFADVG